jgi:hypothetical protein
MVAYGMKLTLMKGIKKVEKFMLRTCRADLTDIAAVHDMDKLITQHDFPDTSRPNWTTLMILRQIHQLWMITIIIGVII